MYCKLHLLRRCPELCCCWSGMQERVLAAREKLFHSIASKRLFTLEFILSLSLSIPAALFMFVTLVALHYSATCLHPSQIALYLRCNAVSHLPFWLIKCSPATSLHLPNLSLFSPIVSHQVAWSMLEFNWDQLGPKKHYNPYQFFVFTLLMNNILYHESHLLWHYPAFRHC